MKKPRLINYFTKDELETLLDNIDMYNRDGMPQNENKRLCDVSKRIAGEQGKKAVDCINCYSCTPTRRSFKLAGKRIRE